MEQLTTYRAKGKTVGLVFLFKYDLNGNLREFKIEGEALNEAQDWWLFTGYLTKEEKEEKFETAKELLQKLKPRMPCKEHQMKTIWMGTKEYQQKFEVDITPADVSFEAFWKLYPPNKLSNKKTALERFNKLKEDEVTKLFQETPNFIKAKKLANQYFPYAEVYIRSRWWDR